MTPDLDADVRRVDEDRWLASRFGTKAERARLTVIYALNYEIARTAEVVTQAAIGDIRLAWWREAITEIHDGKLPRAHPVLQSYALVAGEVELPAALWVGMIEARGADLEAAPFGTWMDLDAFLDATTGNVLRLALAACGQAEPEDFIQTAARAWGGLGLLRAIEHWRARGRSWAPLETAGDADAVLLERTRSAYSEAARHRVSSEAFPAVGYLALTPGYLRALPNGREPALLPRQLRLIAASATGRL